MNQPPPWNPDQPPDQRPDQDQPPKQGKWPSWPSRDQTASWPSGGQQQSWPSGGQQPSWPSGSEQPSWPSGGQQPSWPSSGQSWPSGDQPPSWPSPDQPPGQGPPSGPGYSYGYAPRRLRRRRPLLRAILGIVVVIILGSVVRALVSSGNKSDSTTPPVDLTPTHTAAPGPVGSSFDLQDGSGNTYRIALVKIIDPAQGANDITTPDGGKRFVGLVFTVKALKGSPQNEDADDSAVLIGANGQDYSAAFDAINGYSNFNNGAIKVAQGDTQTGAVTFAVPTGVQVAKVEWTSESGFGSVAEWVVGG